MTKWNRHKTLRLRWKASEKHRAWLRDEERDFWRAIAAGEHLPNRPPLTQSKPN